MKWEYLIVELNSRSDGTWQLDFLENAERRSKVKEHVGSLAAYCTKMGNEGWELTAAVNNGILTYRQLFFKRPRT